MIDRYRLTLDPYPRGFHLITDKVMEHIGEWPTEGLMHVFIPHTSAALTLNENADPSVRADMEKAYDKLVPENEPFYTHTQEGSDDMPAHIKASLTGSSITLPISKGRPDLGTWQGIYLCEFRDNASARRLTITIYS